MQKRIPILLGVKANEKNAALVTEFATGVIGRLEGQFSSMDAIERHIDEIAELAARY